MLTCISIGTYKPDLVRHLADNLDRLVPDLLDGTRQAFDMLEFRGDRVLWIVSTMLIQDEYGHLFADDPRLFAVVAQSLTSNRVFNCILKSLHLWSSATGPKGAADMLEAIVGRIDRVLGFDKVKEVIKELLQPLISAGVEAGVHFAGSDSDNDRDPKVHDQSSSPSPASLLPVIISAVARKYAQLPAYIRIPASFDRKPDMDNVDGLDKRRGKEIMADGIAVGLESGAWTQQQLTACASATLHDALTSVPVQEALADAIGMGTWAGKHEIRVMLGRASHHESIDYMRQIVMRLFNPVMQEALRLVAPLISIYPRNNLDPRRQHIYDAVLLYRAGRPFGTGLTHVQSIWSTNDSTMDALHTYDRLQAIRLI
ncbi:hypothetical protein HDZ31DRAFT_62109 [Schizophyllum fasciatum]